MAETNNILGINLQLEGENIESVSVATIANGSANLEAILEKIALANSLNDTAELNFYTVKNPPTLEPKILTPRFIDNVILYGITTEKRINKNNKQCLDVGRYNSKIKELLTGRKIPLNKIKATNYSVAAELKPEQKKHFLDSTIIDENLEDLKYYRQCFKVPCSELDITEVYKIFSPDNLTKFNACGIYLHDADYTTDIKGCIDKPLLIDYLSKNKNYKLVGDGGDLENDQKIIVNNTKLVGTHCLTFLNKDGGTIKRQK